MDNPETWTYFDTLHNQACKHDDCDCHIITKTDTYRYLGVTIDQHLRWDKHAQLTATRIRKTLYKFRRLRLIMDKDTSRQMHYAIVLSIVQYGILAWGGACETNHESIEVALFALLLRSQCQNLTDIPQSIYTQISTYRHSQKRILNNYLSTDINDT